MGLSINHVTWSNGQGVRQKVTLGHVDMSRGSIRIISSFNSKCMVLSYHIVTFNGE